MDGTTAIPTASSVVEKTLKSDENEDMDLLESIELDASDAEPEAKTDVDNDLVGKDHETANVYQTDRVRILIDPSRDENLTAFGKETLEDRYLLNDEKG